MIRKIKKALILSVLIFILLIVVACGSKSLILTFNTNGGTPIELGDVKQGEVIEAPITTKEGYTFLGWYESSDMTEESRAKFDQAIIRNMTFYAKWRINKYEINIVTNNDVSINKIIYDYNQDITLPTLEREGYTFAGWYESSNFSGQEFNLNKMPARNLTLHAKWTIKEYIITFYLDNDVVVEKRVNHGEDLIDIPLIPQVPGKNRYWDIDDFTNITEDFEVRILSDDIYYIVVVKEDDGTVIETLEVLHGSTFNPKITPSKVGYNFVGYSISLDHIVISNLEVVVIYEKITFLVIFNNHDGPQQQIVNYGEDAIPPIYIAPPGYQFLSWDRPYTNVLSNLTINAVIDTETYEIKLHGNGGIFTSSNDMLIISKDYNEVVGIPEQPSRLGYNFSGWFNNVEGTGTIFSEFSPSYSMPLGGLELYAKWTVRNYPITYNNLNGTTHSNPNSYNINTNNITLTNPTNRVGYTFIGWYDAEFLGNKITVINQGTVGNITLYARFIPIEYSITYFGLDQNEHQNPLIYTIEDSITLTNPEERLGYDFVGWFTNSTGGSQIFSISQGSTENRQLHARWAEIDYMITYENIDGLTHGNPTTYTIEDSFILSAPSEKIGYTFIGWFTDELFENEIIQIDEGRINNLTIYAIFTLIDFNINYHNVGSTEHTNPSTYTIEDKITLLNPTERTGYTFAGWYNAEVGGSVMTTINEGSTDELNLYAKWVAKQYTINFNVGSGDELNELIVYYDQEYHLPQAIKVGYNFTGWQLAGEPFVNGIWQLTEDITLLSTYSPLTHQIHFDVDGGEVVNAIPVTYDQTFTLPEPTKTGYTFTHWEFNGAEFISGTWNMLEDIELLAIYAGNKYNISFDVAGGVEIADQEVTYGNQFSLNPATKTGYTFTHWEYNGAEFTSGTWNMLEDIELIAIYAGNKYNISFAVAGGAEIADQEVTYGNEFSLNPASKTGYTFTHWEYNGAEFISGTWNMLENIELLAIYVPKIYTITYDLDGGVGTTTQDVIFDENYILQIPTKENYNFNTWLYLGNPIANTGVWGHADHITLLATWTEWAIITFNSNGGLIVNSITQAPGTELNEPVSPTRTGYHFEYWYETDNQVPYVFSLMPDNDLQLNAKYSLITYDIVYIGTGDLTNNNPTSYNIETELITLNNLTNKTGYTFNGWFNQSTGGSKVTTIPKGSVGGKTLYARWTPNQYSVTFNVDGGEALDPVIINYDQEYNLPVAVKVGYSFTGWLLEGVPFTDGIWNLTENIVLEATYNAESYLIHFNVDGGITIDSLLVVFNETFELEDASKTGFEFSHWQREGMPFNEGTWNITSNITLLAIYTPITYTIRFIVSGGVQIADQLIQFNDPINLSDAVKTGYNFSQWEYEGVLFTDSIWNIANDIDLVATFMPKTYTVTFNISGGEELDPVTFTYDQPYTLPTTTKVGYDFLNWEYEGVEVNTPLWQIAENVELTAIYTPKEYTITFQVIDGDEIAPLTVTYGQSFNLSDAAKVGYSFVHWEYEGTLFTDGIWNIANDIELVAIFNIITYAIIYENLYEIEHANPTSYKIVDIITLVEPNQRLGYNFDGWYNALSGGIEVTNIENSTGEIRLYARWSLIEYNIYYENLFESSANNQTSITIISTLLLLDPSIRTGYKFLGWYTELDTGVRVLEIEEGNTTEITLYARWEIAYYDVFGTIIFEKVDISSDNTSTLETITHEGEDTFAYVHQLHGTIIYPIININGYAFNKMIYQGVTIENINEFITVTENINPEDLEIYYRRIILELAFVQQENYGINEILRTDLLYIHHNDSLNQLNIPILIQPTNITAVWEKQTLKNVRESMTISALYFNSEVKTIRFKDRDSIIFIASRPNGGGGLVFIGIEALLWTLERPGFKFNGWYYMSDGEETLLVPNSYNFNHFGTNDTSVDIYTKWSPLPKFNKVENINVLIDNNENITITWELDITGLAQLALDELKFDLYIDQILVNDFLIVITQTGNTFTLVVNTEDDQYYLFESLIEAGTHSIEIQAITNDSSIVISGDKSDAKIFEVTSIYDNIPTSTSVYDYFIIEEFDEETLRYVFYTNMTYQFNVTNQFEIISGFDLVELPNANTLSIKNIAGTFKFSITKDGITKVYDALVIKDIKQFSLGNNYLQYMFETSIESSFKDGGNPYYVGVENPFYLDIRMANSIGNRINLNDALLNYDIYLFNGSNYILINDNDLTNHLEFLPQNRLQFKENTIGNKYQIKVEPRYEASKMNVNQLTYEFEITSGVNVFNNQELKEAYSDPGIAKINIHANINPVLTSSQLNNDGSPKNVRNGAGNVYNRNFSSDNDNIVIEGNYMTINGSELPFSNVRSGSGHVGFADSFEIVNVQIAIFNYNVIGVVGNNNLAINNLMIIGNTVVPSINFGGTAEEILLQERLMSRNSGGYMGVMVNNGSASLDNLQIRFAVIGVSHNAKGNDVIIDNSIIDDSWANSIYVQGGTLLSIDNSYVGQSGGPAFHVSDNTAGGGVNNPKIDITPTTEINNFVSGEEAWFKAYGMTLLAIQLKSNIESAVSTAGRSIIELVKNPITGIETEMINFILLTEPHNSANVYDENDILIGGSEVEINISGVSLERSWNYLTQGDPRIVSGQLGAAIGMYSRAVDFGSLYNGIYTGLYNYLIGTGSTQQQALQTISDLAQFASLYNLTVNQTLDYATNPTPENLISIIINNGIIIPKYFEVLTEIPLFATGYATIIVELH